MHRNCCICHVKLFKKSVSDHCSVDFLGKGRVFNLKSLVRVSTLLYTSPEKGAVISKIQNLDPPTILGDEQTFNNKIESMIVKEILNDEMDPTDFDGDNDDNSVSDIPFGNAAEILNLKKMILVRTFRNYSKQILALITNLLLRT